MPRTGRYEVQARVALVPAVALVGTAAWLILEDHPRWAGAATAAATALLLFAAVRASASRDRVLRFLDSVTDRSFDGALLPAIAIAMRHEHPVVSGLAVGAVGMSFLAAYMRARGWALSYSVGDSLVVRAARGVALAAGLATGGLFAALVAILVLTTWTAVDEARQVGMQGA
ncbi:MAG: hypothetical protein ABR600_10375 [Actinomycetota bacterium]